MNSAVDNSAARLLRIIEAGKKHNGTKPCKEVWFEILNVPPNDIPLLWKRLGMVQSLVGEISSDLNELEGINGIDPSAFLGWVPAVHNAFAHQNVEDTWASFSRHIDNNAISFLKTSSAILAAHGKQSPTLASVQDLVVAIDTLVNEISGSELSVPVKTYMVRKLREIQAAIEECMITGFDRLWEVVDSTFGHAMLNQEFYEAKESPASHGFWHVIGRLALLSMISLNPNELPSSAQACLPAPVIASMRAEANVDADANVEIDSIFRLDFSSKTIVVNQNKSVTFNQHGDVIPD